MQKMSLQLRAIKRKIRLLYRYSSRAFAGQPNKQCTDVADHKSLGCWQLQDYPAFHSVPVNTVLASLLRPRYAAKVDTLDSSQQDTAGAVMYWNWTDNSDKTLSCDNTEILHTRLHFDSRHQQSNNNKDLPELQIVVKKDCLPTLLDCTENNHVFRLSKDKPVSADLAYIPVRDGESGVIFRDVVPVQMYHKSSCHSHDSNIDYHSHSMHYEGKVASMSPEFTAFCTGQLETSGNKPMGSSDKQPEGGQGRPTQEQLFKVQEYLIESLPKIFVKPTNYKLTSPDIVFENNYWGKNKTVRGLSAYGWEVVKVRIACSLKYVHATFLILKVTVHPEDDTIRMRWRISGIPQTKVFLPYKFLPWRYKKTIEDESQWNDGFSIFRVNEKGVIVHHRVERVMPDEEVAKANKVVSKLGLSMLITIIPKPLMDGLMSIGINVFSGSKQPESVPPYGHT